MPNTNFLDRGKKLASLAVSFEKSLSPPIAPQPIQVQPEQKHHDWGQEHYRAYQRKAKVISFITKDKNWLLFKAKDEP